MIVQNTKTQRQLNLRTFRGFKKTVETPLSVCLPLILHSKIRDKNIVSTLSQLYIGNEYRHLIDLEKRIEFAVQKRMLSTGGYCLPDFVKKNTPIWFAMDNIDFLESTAYGQNTFHGTLLVLFQSDIDGESINSPLEIADKPLAKPLQMAIKYCEPPLIKTKPIRFSEYKFNQNIQTLSRYSQFTHTHGHWLQN